MHLHVAGAKGGWVGYKGQQSMELGRGMGGDRRERYNSFLRSCPKLCPSLQW